MRLWMIITTMSKLVAIENIHVMITNWWFLSNFIIGIVRCVLLLYSFFYVLFCSDTFMTPMIVIPSLIFSPQFYVSRHNLKVHRHEPPPSSSFLNLFYDGNSIKKIKQKSTKMRFGSFQKGICQAIIIRAQDLKS